MPRTPASRWPSLFAWATSGMSSSISQVLWVCRKSWKCMPAMVGWLVGAAVAVDRRGGHATGHRGAAEQAAAGAGEHEVVVVAVQQRRQFGDQERWQVDVAGGVAGLGW